MANHDKVGSLNENTSQYLAYLISLNELRWNLSENLLRKINLGEYPIPKLWTDDDVMLIKELGLDESQLKRIRNYQTRIRFNELMREITKSEELGIEIITIFDKDYPKLLLNRFTKEFPSPIVLFRRGNLKKIGKAAAIVGTRNPTLRARLIALRLSEQLVKSGYTIVSGLARGIDELAHTGALKYRAGKTVAILPWMDPLYPPEHSELAGDIEKRGVIISDRLSDAKNLMSRFRFVQRNAITSGISDFVIAIESDEDGGTIRQAEIAVKQGVSLYALKPKNSERAQRGFNKLLSLGAKPFEEVEDLISQTKSNKERTLDME